MIFLESSMRSDCKLVDTNNSLTALAQLTKGLKSTKVSPKHPDSLFAAQVILSPVDSVADTYRALLPEGTPMEFQRILELKVTFLLLFCSYFIKFYLKFI